MSELQAWLGRAQSHSDRVTAGALARFMATLESRCSPAPATVPPGFHWCLCLPEDPLGALGADGHPRTGGFLPPLPLPRRMWAAGSVEFLSAIRVDAAIERRSVIARITEKPGKSGPMAFVDVDHLMRADGVDAVRERQTLVYREPPSQPLSLPPAIAVDTAQWQFSRSLVPNEALLFRFSALTFNSHRIHYDLPYAQQQEGYPALVVQGPLSAALLLDLAALRCGCDAIARFSFRAVSPAFVGQTLHLVGRDSASGLQLAALGADGRTVMEAHADLR